ncbi:MAG: hypothetical protein GY950_08745 [bacterium]|nr:hypothetical protein [bacterium]
MKINRIIVSMLIFLMSGFPISLLIAQESGADSRANYFEDIGDEASMNWTTKVLRVKGNGFGPERIKNLGRRKILAKRAAKVDAYRNLVEVIKGVRVTSNTSVEDMMLESDSIKTRTNGMLKGARVVAVTYSSDGGCEITMEVNIDRSGQFLLAALNTDNARVTDNYPKFDWNKVQKELGTTKAQLAHSQIELDKTKKELRKKEDLINSNRREVKDRPHYASSSTAPGKIKDSNEPVKTVPVNKPPAPEVKKDYSGLLVDARGLDLKPTLAPAILNPKKEKMYGIGVIPTKVTGGSTADYLPGNIEHARKYKKITDWPLVVKGIDVINESDVIIGNEDAQKLVLIRDLLEQRKVVIVLKD